jgi:hypothetical protein
VSAAAAPPEHRRRPAALTDEEVLTAVIELGSRYRAPSTSLISSRLAPNGTVTSALQTGVRSALQRLHARGEVSCVSHRGTHHWSATRPGA